MFESIVPDSVVVVETHEDLLAPLFAEEEELVARAVAKRRNEFSTGRACARIGLARLGLPSQAIGAGASGQPIWPAGVVGSITHCDGLRACAVASQSDITTIGIDAEPNLPLPPAVLPLVTRPEETEWLADLARTGREVNFDRLLFSIKESIFKAWFPAAETWLGFEDASVTVDVSTRSFNAALLVGGMEGRAGLSGQWLATEDFLLSAVTCE
jgi:4'-phosphopantetheinyl transferase EntD